MLSSDFFTGIIGSQAHRLNFISPPELKLSLHILEAKTQFFFKVKNDHLTPKSKS